MNLLDALTSSELLRPVVPIPTEHYTIEWKRAGPNVIMVSRFDVPVIGLYGLIARCIVRPLFRQRKEVHDLFAPHPTTYGIELVLLASDAMPFYSGAGKRFAVMRDGPQISMQQVDGKERFIFQTSQTSVRGDDHRD